MSMVGSLVQPLINQYEPDGLDRNEYRISRYGALAKTQEFTKSPMSILTPKNDELVKKSFGNTVKIPVIDFNSGLTVSNSRSCTITGPEDTSHLISLSFATYAISFTMVPAQYFNNYVDYATAFQKKLTARLMLLASTLDTACRNNIDTNVNAYFPPNILNYYGQIGNAFQVSQAQKDDFFNNLTAMMMEADYYTDTHILGSTSLLPLVNRLKNQSSQNATNQSFQLDPWKWSTSNRITNNANVQSTIYAIPEGQFAITSRLDPDAIAGEKIGGGDRPIQQWGRQYLPIVGMEFGYYNTNNCSDQSALQSGTTGLTRTLLEGWEFSLDICLMAAYNSSPTTLFSPCFKAEISNN